MKQILLLITCCIFSGASYAQIQAGNKIIGGTVGGSFDSPNGVTKTTSFNLKPMAGYFLSNNWMVGISGEHKRDFSDRYSSSSVTYDDNYLEYVTNDTRQSTFAVGPVARYYQPLNQKLAFFGEGNMGYSFTNQKANVTQRNTYSGSFKDEFDFEVTSKAQQLYAHIAPGIVFFPKPKLAVELKATILSYYHGIGDSPYENLLEPPFDDVRIIFAYDPSKQRNFKTNFSLSATSLGIGYYF